MAAWFCLLMGLVCCKILRSEPLSLLNCPHSTAACEGKKQHKARGKLKQKQEMREARELKWMTCQQEKSQIQIRDLDTSHLSGWIIPLVKEEPELSEPTSSSCPKTALTTQPGGGYQSSHPHIYSLPQEKGECSGNQKKHSEEEKGRMAVWTVNFKADFSAPYGFGWLCRQDWKLMIMRNLDGRHADGSGI